MKLNDLGFDDWFERHAGGVSARADGTARVTAMDRDRYLVRNESAEIPAELAGKLRFEAQSWDELPCVGDWVAVQYCNSGASAIVHAVYPRKTFLRRKFAGKNVGLQMIAANVDVAFIVQSCGVDFNLRRLDRYLVVTNEGGIEPIVLLTKTDLVSSEDLELRIAAIRECGVTSRIIGVSNVTGAGIEDFRKLLAAGRTYCLIGSSGVGKTTLINRLMGRDAFETKPVSGTGRGTHATARRQLVALDGGAMLVDTPGMRELGLLGAGETVDRSFGDLRDLSSGCRYSDCTHTNEPGCAILDAVARGELSEEHHRNYLKLRKESEHHAMSYAERRRKNRAFGRFIKSAKKQRSDLKPKG